MKQAIKGLNPEWYELEDEKGEPDATAFYMAPLDGFGRAEISMLTLSARAGDAGAAAAAGAAVMNAAFKLGVKNWKNIENPDDPGNALPFSRKNMVFMQPEWIIEVGARVLEISEMGPDEVKN